MLNVLDTFNRSLSGKVIEEKDFDNRVLPQKLMELAKEYDIKYTGEEIVPLDMDLIDSVYSAAIDLLVDVGVYNASTSRVIEFDEKEIKNHMDTCAGREDYGSGNDKITLVKRNLEDNSRAPVVFGGTGGGGMSQEYIVKHAQSIAQEPLIKGIHTPTLPNLYDMDIKAGTPIELMAARSEIMWTREGLYRAGKPGFPIIGVMSAVSTEGQFFADAPGALRPEDMHTICFMNDMKLDWAILNKIANTSLNNYKPLSCMCPILGGYTGGPATTAIATVAEGIYTYLLTGSELYVMTAPLNMMTGEGSSPHAVWSTSLAMASLTRNSNLMTSLYVFPSAGMCTEMFMNETAVLAGATTAVGASHFVGPCGLVGAQTDYSSGMDGRICAEIGIAASKMSLEEMNEFGLELAKTYTEAVTSGKAPVGKKFNECYDLKTVKPSQEFEDLWASSKAKLSDMGLDFE